MDTESESPRKPPLPGIAWPSAFLVVVGLFAYLNYRPPLETARPELQSEPCEPPPKTVSNVGAAYARLWEDPLEAAYRDEKRRKASSTFWTDKNLDDFDCHGFRDLVAPCLKDRNHHLLFMPILVPGSPYAEDKEKRMRTRYALLAALGTRGYKLTLGDRMSYIHVPITTAFDIMDAEIRQTLAVPVKLYRRDPVVEYDGHFGGVLVCWLNQTQLGDRPLSAVFDIYEHLFPNCQRENGKIAIRIIGPADSDTLRRMVKNVDESKGIVCRASDHATPRKFPKGTKLYSPWATVSPEVIKWDKGASEACRKFSLKAAGIELIRTCGSDRQLAVALLDELVLRGAWYDKPGAAAGGPAPPSHLVLVTERDTLYGRAIPEVFRMEIDRRSGFASTANPLRADDPRRPSNANLHVFTYLRGIDGARAEQGGSNQKREEDGDQAEHTEGCAQLDYLRRMEQRVTQLDERLRQEGRGRVTAIGVMGSDFYDKLLVLRAMRRQFPRVAFFTTDLDAGLWLADEWPHTRNTVVASHFGLSLARDLQPETPPFREGYQTAVFFTTLLALDHRKLQYAVTNGTWNPRDPWGLGTASADAPHLEPLVFEIGRSGAYQFTNPAAGIRNGSGRIQTESSNARPWIQSRWKALGILSACLLVVVSVFSETVRERVKKIARPVVAGSAMLLLLVLAALVYLGITIWYDHRAPDGEPFLIFEGISVWPSTVLRLGIAALAALFLYKALCDLAKNDNDLLQEYFPKEGQSPTSGFWSRLRQWPDAGRPTTPTAWAFLEPVRRGVFFAWYWPEQQDLSATELERQYRFLAQWPWRLLRVVLLSALYSIFARYLFTATEFLYMPYRGETSHIVGKLILRVAVIGMIVLLFFVIDAAELCRRFVRAVKEPSCHWPESTIAKSQQTWNRVDRADLRDLLAVRLIGQRTEVVGKLIYWPCIIILLLILSRLRVFDNWDFSWPLVVLIGLNLAGAVVCGAALRRTANKARREIVRRLKDRQAAVAGQFGAKEKSEQLKLLVAEIETKRQGAFTPWYEDPILVSLVLPFGGVSGLLFIEHLLAIF